MEPEVSLPCSKSPFEDPCNIS